MRHTAKLAAVLGSVAIVAMAASAFAEGTFVAEKEPRQRLEKRRLEQRKDMHRGPGFKRNMVTGEFKVQTTDGFATVRIDQGTVTSAGDGAISLKRADGETVTVAIADETVIRKDRSPAGIDDVEPGDLVRVMRVDDGDGFEVRRVMVRSPGSERAPKANRKTRFTL